MHIVLHFLSNKRFASFMIPIKWTVLWIMDCCLFGDKPLHKPMFTHCHMNPYEQSSVKFENASEMLSAKCLPFCLGDNVFNCSAPNYHSKQWRFSLYVWLPDCCSVIWEHCILPGCRSAMWKHCMLQDRLPIVWEHCILQDCRSVRWDHWILPGCCPVIWEHWILPDCCSVIWEHCILQDCWSTIWEHCILQDCWSIIWEQCILQDCWSIIWEHCILQNCW